MTTGETIPLEYRNTRAKKLAASFIPLLICYVGSAVISFFASHALCTESCYISCPLPTDSIYGVLSSMALYLKSGVVQILLILLSVFTMIPSWISAGVAVYRGLCTGLALYSVSQGLVLGAGSPKASVSLYFLSSVLLLLLSALSCTCSDTLAQLRSRRERRNTHALIFAYLQIFTVMAGGFLAVTAFAILFC